MISLISKSTAHNNANSAPAKEAVNDYDLWINGWVIQNIGVLDTSPPSKDYPMIDLYDYFAINEMHPP